MKRRQVIQVITLTGLLLLAVAWLTAGDRGEVIHFDHVFHSVEVGAACDDCHPGIAELGGGERSMPAHDACGICHDVEDACGTCHLNPDEPVAVPPVEGMYQGFGHDNHRTLDCSRCHGDLEATRAEPVIPGMAECVHCHASSGAADDCGVCHLGETPLPDDHRLSTWGRDHGLEAAVESSDCMVCHDETSCNDCHQDQRVEGIFHPPDWVFNHFVEATFGGECLSCHETREQCITCHRQMIGYPRNHRTPDWTNRVDGGRHAESARSFMESCLTCHDPGGAEPACVKCHD